MSKDAEMSDTERHVSLGIGIGHAVGGAVLTGLGMGGFVPMIGEVEDQILDASFEDRKARRISPGTAVRQAVRESSGNGFTPKQARNQMTTEATPIRDEHGETVVRMYGTK